MAKGTMMKNTTWLVMSHMYSMVISLTVGPLTARCLGPSLYGYLTYSESLVNIFNVFAQLGMSSIAIAELVQNPDRRDETMGTMLVMRLVASIVCAFLTVITVLILRPNNPMLRLVTILEASVIIVQIYDVFGFWFQSELLSKYTAMISMISLTLISAYKVYLYLYNPSIYAFAISSGIRLFLTMLMIVVLFFHMNPHAKLNFNKELGKYLLSRGYHFVLGGIGSLIYYQVDKVMVGEMVDEASLGFYGVSNVLIQAWQYIPLAVVSSISPLILAAKKRSDEEYKQKYKLLIAGILGLFVIAGFFALLLTKPVILTLYGEAYAMSVPLFLILFWSTLFAVLSSARYTWILCEKKEKYAKYFTAVGAVTDIVMNFILIRLFGVVGAALATLFTEMAVYLLAPVFFPDTRETLSLFVGSFREFGNLSILVKGYLGKVWKKVRGGVN